MAFPSRIKHSLGWLNRCIANLEDGLLALLLGVMILLSTGQIFARNLFDTGLDWSDPFLRVLVLWLGLLGAMVATRERNHITIDVLSRNLPPLGKRISHIATNLFSSVVCAIVGYHSTRFVIMEYEDGFNAFASIPAWICESIIPIGFTLMALRFALYALGDVVNVHIPPTKIQTSQTPP